MSDLTTDREHPGLRKAKENGQSEAYLVLSEEELAKGFVRPYRESYKHVGERPKHPTRELTAEEKKRYAGEGYAMREDYPKSESPVSGRYWTQEQLDSGCGTVTTMSEALARTYAHSPEFYGETFCCGCVTHFPVKEFTWVPDGSVVGS